MSGQSPTVFIESVPVLEVAGALSHTRAFAKSNVQDALREVERVDLVRAQAGEVIVGAGEKEEYFWLVVEGEAKAERPEPDGTWTTMGFVKTGESFGEVPLLTGRTYTNFRFTAVEDTVLVRMCSQEFWTLMACCPEARKTIRSDMSKRLQAHQVEVLHREKLVSLGTMAAGLMHELNNPGAAARRASSQMRENLLRLQQLSLRASSEPMTAEQLECLHGLLETTLSARPRPVLSSLEQADAEDAMVDWLTASGVENSLAIAPVLVDAGLTQDELACARANFSGGGFSGALNWLGALVSNVSLVGTVEESVTRIAELVAAVKTFAYDDRAAGKEVDVHHSLESTLTILGHKLRVKGISAVKKFGASPSKIVLRGPAISQVWTNILDNAIDASPENAKIEVATWSEPDALVVAIEDHGPGIPPEVLPHIFEPFFTTKPQGSGTGLGLEIVYRIVTESLGGAIEVQSQPGSTKFIVRLPSSPAAELAA